ncbi:MAG: hypothetical protein J0I14_04880 [Propionibacteriaceae bacterium]|jgi:hypothetical protein|nr:hypothetical protein [Propionibacteriaceae bacterium]
MTDQQPTRFENYPPDTSAAPFAGADPVPPSPPAVSPSPPAVYSSPVPAAPPPTHTRRNVIVGLIALAIGGPVVAQAGWAGFGDSDAPDDETETWPSDPEEEEEPVDEPTEFSAGEYNGPIPTGWELADGSDGSMAVLRRGANQVTVLSWSPESERPWPADDITEAVTRAATGFKGTLGKPVNGSTGTRTMATLSAKGTFLGERAREFAELWLDDNEAYLLLVTTLTADEGSVIAREATDIVWNLTSGLR